MKLSHGITLSVLIFIAVIIGVLVFVWSSIDGIVEAAIEQYGSEVTQTSVRVDSVKITLTSGEGTISGLTVGNPPGFSAPDVFALGNISTRVDTSSVTEPTIVINEVMINAPKVFYEINDAGQSNIDTLKENIASAIGSSQTSGGGNDRKLIIERLVIDQGEIDVRIAALGDKSLSAKLPRIVLTNIGKREGGASPEAVAEKVVNALMKNARTGISALNVDKYLGKSIDDIKAMSTDLGKELTGRAGGSVEDVVKQGGEALKGLLGR